VVGVGPFEREGAVEPFDLPVRLRPVGRSGEFMATVPSATVNS
jgi:hypothetical protein